MTIENIDSGEYLLSVLHDEYLPMKQPIMVPRSDELTLTTVLDRAVPLRFDPELPAGSLVKVYDEAGKLVLDIEGDKIIRVRTGYNRLVIDNESFRPQEIEIEAEGEEEKVSFRPVYYAPKLVFSSLLSESQVFLDGEDVTDQISNNKLVTKTGSHEVSVLTENYLPMTRVVVLAEDEEFVIDILNIADPSVTSQRTKTLILSTVVPGIVLFTGGLVMNLNPIAVNITNSYSGYVTLKYTTLGTAAAGLLLATVGTVVVLSK